MTENALKLNLLVYGIAALVIAVPGYFIVGDMVSEPGVGDCAEPAAEAGGGFEMDRTDCSAAEAAYRLVKIDLKRSCPRGDYLEQRKGKAGKSGGSKHFCYVLNVREGDCLKQVDAFHQRVACGTAAARRVSKLVTGDDRALCGGAEARAYPDPAMTVCLEKA